MKCRRTRKGAAAVTLVATAIPLIGWVNAAQAQYVPIYGGLTYDSASGNGYTNAGFIGRLSVNDNGVAVGYATDFVGGASNGARAVRWDSSGGRRNWLICRRARRSGKRV